MAGSIAPNYMLPPDAPRAMLMDGCVGGAGGEGEGARDAAPAVVAELFGLASSVLPQQRSPGASQVCSWALAKGTRGREGFGIQPKPRGKQEKLGQVLPIYPFPIIVEMTQRAALRSCHGL